MGVFHEGERAVQKRAGVTAEARSLGRGISSVLPAGIGPFVQAQRMAILAAADDRGRLWASLVMGKPGFITAPDEHTLSLAAELPAADPVSACLENDRPLGVLVFDPARRRRLRLNGRVIAGRDGRIDIRINEVFGNCQKYIQARAPEPETTHERSGDGRHSEALRAPQRLAIERADTFFIASAHEGSGADASHRGGLPGFVRVMGERTLRFPDYVGNNMFQTLGNISTDPRVGLLFVDFESGTTLQLTGRAHILWDREDVHELPGAERAVEVEIEEVVEIAGGGPLGWRFLGYSSFNPR
jgi:predicted pyridoxine 5'-phosphate oxidase superfamily flavin-nucleotide-binding protein